MKRRLTSLLVGLETKALLLDFDKDFVDEEFPLLQADNKKYYYEAAYEPLDDSDEIVVYNNGTAARQPGCAISMVLPEDTYALKYIDLTTGRQASESLSSDNYIFQVSNPNFRVDNVNGRPVISVISIPQNVRLMQCDLTVTYKHGKPAFSTFDMSATLHLAWTNMTAAEYQQVYIVSGTRAQGGLIAIATGDDDTFVENCVSSATVVGITDPNGRIGGSGNFTMTNYDTRPLPSGGDSF